MLSKGVSLKPACILLSSLGVHTEVTDTYLPRRKRAAGTAGVCDDEAAAVLLAPCRMAATSLAAACPCSRGITCRGNPGWRVLVIARCLAGPQGQQGIPCCWEPSAALPCSTRRWSQQHSHPQFAPMVVVGEEEEDLAESCKAPHLSPSFLPLPAGQSTLWQWEEAGSCL